MFKLLALIVASILITTLQLGFLPGLSQTLGLLINLPLLFVVYLAFFYDFELSIIGAFLLGLLLDIYSSLFFGFYLLLFLLIVLAIKLLVTHILQSKNLTSLLVINLVAIIIWHIIYLATIFISAQFSNSEAGSLISTNYFTHLVYQIIIHFILVLFTSQFFLSRNTKLNAHLVD